MIFYRLADIYLGGVPMQYQNKNENFFDYPRRDNSYWAGFIAADGNVYKNALKIALSSKDAEHLSKLASTLNPDFKLREVLTRYSADYKYTKVVQFQFNSKHTVEKLEKNWNITENKTFTLKFPSTLSRENKMAYICGYIDGDGSIIVNTKRNKLYLSVCGNEDFLLDMREFFREEGVILNNNIYESRNIHVLMVGGSKARDLLNSLYGEDIPLLDRKWSKIKEGEYIFNQYKVWTEEDKNLIIEKYKSMTLKEIWKKYYPEITFHSIERWISNNGIHKPGKTPEQKWNKEETKLLQDCIKKGMTTKEIHSKIFPYRTFESIKGKRFRNNKKQGKHEDIKY